MSCGNNATAFFPGLGQILCCLGQKVQFALPDSCLRGITVPRGCSKPAKWFYLPENTLNFEQCLFPLHASAACARLTR
jgi:hypothetical protein